MKPLPEMKFTDFAAKYCERQDQTPDGLKEVLLKQKQKFNPDGWAMLECEMMDSSWLGSLTIIPYGPNNTFKAPPEHAVSPRGLCSDMSVVVATLNAKEVA